LRRLQTYSRQGGGDSVFDLHVPYEQGRIDEPVAPRSGKTQLSRIVTLKRDSRDPDEILVQLEGPMARLLEEVRRITSSSKTSCRCTELGPVTVIED